MLLLKGDNMKDKTLSYFFIIYYVAILFLLNTPYALASFFMLVGAVLIQEIRIYKLFDIIDKSNIWGK